MSPLREFRISISRLRSFKLLSANFEKSLEISLSSPALLSLNSGDVEFGAPAWGKYRHHEKETNGGRGGIRREENDSENRGTASSAKVRNSSRFPLSNFHEFSDEVMDLRVIVSPGKCISWSINIARNGRYAINNRVINGKKDSLKICMFCTYSDSDKKKLIIWKYRFSQNIRYRVSFQYFLYIN